MRLVVAVLLLMLPVVAVGVAPVKGALVPLDALGGSSSSSRRTSCSSLLWAARCGAIVAVVAVAGVARTPVVREPSRSVPAVGWAQGVARALVAREPSRWHPAVDDAQGVARALVAREPSRRHPAVAAAQGVARAPVAREPPHLSAGVCEVQGVARAQAAREPPGAPHIAAGAHAAECIGSCAPAAVHIASFAPSSRRLVGLCRAAGVARLGSAVRTSEVASPCEGTPGPGGPDSRVVTLGGARGVARAPVAREPLGPGGVTPLEGTHPLLAVRTNQRSLQYGSAGRGSQVVLSGLRFDDHVAPDVGVDTLRVRRKNAAVLHRYTKGSFIKAREMLRNPDAKARGLARLHEDIYAKTTRRTMRARLATLIKLSNSAGVDLLPATVHSVHLLAAALKEGGYRSGGSYLGILAKEHMRANYVWSPDLTCAAAEARRSLSRGLGPEKRARTVDLEAVTTRSNGKCMAAVVDVDFVIVGALWLLRGAEAAALLGEQATVDDDNLQACLVLGATKTNPGGRDCKRSLRCCCKEGGPQGLGAAICPVHALLRVLARRAARGLTGKHPLFAGRGGCAITAAGARQAICRACGEDGMTEHSMRRMGAQFYARRGVPLAIIQHIGRWGSAAVQRYVEHALEGRASWAPLVASGGLDVGQVVGACGGSGQATFDLQLIEGLVRHCVEQKVALDRRAKRRRAAAGAAPVPEVGPQVAALRAELKADIAHVADLAAGSLVAVRSTRTSGCHLVKVAGRAFHPRQWVTHCGWYFGTAPHEPCAPADVKCRRGCLNASRQVGGGTGRGDGILAGQRPQAA